MAFYSRYYLDQIPVGGTQTFNPQSPEEHKRICRSAHNYNLRTPMYFSTRTKNGVLYVTRLR